MNVRNSLEEKKRNGLESPCEGVDELEERWVDRFLLGDRFRDRRCAYGFSTNAEESIALAVDRCARRRARESAR
jgi:hypothetical protein